MPRIDGVPSAMLVFKHYPGTQIILMSADDTPEVRDRGLCCGAIRFIRKAKFAQSSHQHLVFRLVTSFTKCLDTS